MMTTKEFLRKNDLEMDDIEFITDLVTMGRTFDQIGEEMGLDAEELRKFWEGE